MLSNLLLPPDFKCLVVHWMLVVLNNIIIPDVRVS